MRGGKAAVGSRGGPGAIDADLQAQFDALGSGLLEKTGTALTIATAGTDYVAPNGVAGGQTINGGTAASETLTLKGTAHATLGTVRIGGANLFEFNETDVVLTIGASEAGVVAGSRLRVYNAGDAKITLRDTTNNVEAVIGATSTDVRVLAATASAIIFGSNNAESFRVTAGGDIQTVNNVHWVLGTVSGSKFGTATSQKIGFWNATPVVQGAAVADAAGGATVDAEARTAINTLLARMRTYGLIAT